MSRTHRVTLAPFLPMKRTDNLVYYRGRWPDSEIPAGESEWVLYEVSYARDAVLRSVDVFADGTMTRDSIEIEQRHGDHCPSLIDIPLRDAFPGAALEEISQRDFEDAWDKGVDTPFWFVR